MLFLLGLFLGFVLGFFVAALCNIAGEKAPNICAENSSPTVHDLSESLDMHGDKLAAQQK
jgi:hypothetical protein